MKSTGVHSLGLLSIFYRLNTPVASAPVGYKDSCPTDDNDGNDNKGSNTITQVFWPAPTSVPSFEPKPFPAAFFTTLTALP